jgi:hypothetical protein
MFPQKDFNFSQFGKSIKKAQLVYMIPKEIRQTSIPNPKSYIYFGKGNKIQGTIFIVISRKNESHVLLKFHNSI